MVVHGATLTGFEVAGEDQHFFPAEAKIEGNEVVLSSAHVAKPVAARYGWADDPSAVFITGRDCRRRRSAVMTGK